MTTTINHDIRQKIGVTVLEYTIADMIHQTRMDGPSDLTKDDMHNITGASKNAIKGALEVLEEKGLIVGIGKVYNTTDIWMKATVLQSEVVDLSSTFYQEVAERSVEYLNEKLGKSKGYDWKTYEKLFKTIVYDLKKRYKDLSDERIQKNVRAVIDFKYQSWCDDPEMSKYLQPSTLFGGKFKRYLDEARTFYKNH